MDEEDRDLEWEMIEDPAERRRAQNRIAQRNYREETCNPSWCEF